MPLLKPGVNVTSVDVSEGQGAFRMLAPLALLAANGDAPATSLDTPWQTRIIIVDAAGVAIEKNLTLTDDEFHLLRE